MNDPVRKWFASESERNRIVDVLQMHPDDAADVDYRLIGLLSLAIECRDKWIPKPGRPDAPNLQDVLASRLPVSIVMTDSTCKYMGHTFSPAEVFDLMLTYGYRKLTAAELHDGISVVYFAHGVA